MATSLRDIDNPPHQAGGHHRSKSSVLKNLMHRRNQSDDASNNLPSSLSIPTASPEKGPLHSPAATGYARSPGGALGELQQNQQDAAGSRSPHKSRGERNGQGSESRGRSPTKAAFSTFSRIAGKSRERSPDKPKKTKSSTNIAGLLSRPKSSKGLRKLALEEELRAGKDKENRTPPASNSTVDLGGPPPPIYAQFSSQDLGQHIQGKSSLDLGSAHGSRNTDDSLIAAAKGGKDRPKSFQPYMATKMDTRSNDSLSAPFRKNNLDKERHVSSSEKAASKAQRPKIFTAFSSTETRSEKGSLHGQDHDSGIGPKDIDGHLEAMLDRRNIPENQRFKMRNLNSTIKMEFIRQDWAEMAAKADATPVNDGPSNGVSGAATFDITSSSAVGGGTDSEENSHPKRTRGRSFTLGRSKKDKDSKSPIKKSKGEGTIGRHFRTKSSESIGSEQQRPGSSGSGAVSNNSGGGIMSKISKIGQGPGDFVSYLRKVQKPEVVEVGKLHKLRLLLRNETVSWTEEFIQLGGMEEIVGLLNRILEVEWREEHEDALLHENLLCLKALCTTALALQYLHSIHTDLFPKLTHMIFDPERKGPSEFTTRSIITSILFTYIESVGPQERIIRAKSVLSFLRNPEPKEEERPVPFVLEMRKERPYTVWNKEAVNVTKEVFWIFLHHLNVIALPAEMSSKGGAQVETKTPASAARANDNSGPQLQQLQQQQQPSSSASAPTPSAYMHKHFPKPPPPVPAAPYVGGVEWDATNYLASHLDLANAIIACTPTAAQRNALRAEMRISGWERCMGGSLRLCKEKFYGCVHEALRTWVAAAAEDGWEVRDVRYGPPPEASSSPKRKKPAPPPSGGNGDGNQKNGAGGGGGGGGAAPRIEMPKMDFGLPGPEAQREKERDYWLS